jgi:hypothetical protein
MKKGIATAGAMIVAVMMMAATQGVIVAQDNEDEGDDIDQIKSELSSKTVSYDFKETQFRDVINRIRQQVSFNIIISDKVDQMLGKGGGTNNAAGGGNASGGFGSSSSGSSGGFGSSGSSDSGGGFGSSGGGGSSSGGFGSSGGSSSGGFGSSGGNSGGGSGGFGSSGSSSSGGFGSSGGNSSGGFGSSGGSSSGGFGSSGGSSSGGFGSSGGSSGGGFGSSGGSSGFGGSGGASGGGQTMNLDDKVTIKLDDVTIMRALKLILDQKNLTAVFKLGAVHIVPKDEAQNFDIRFYDVRDLQYKLKDFKSDVTRFHQTGGYTGSDSGGGSGSGSSGEFLNNQMFGNDSGSSNKQIITNEKEFMKLIQGNVGSKQDWQGKASIKMTSGILVVNQTPEIHNEIDFLINRLRQFK